MAEHSLPTLRDPPHTQLKATMQNRQHHQQEVHGFLQTHFGGAYWGFAFPGGSGNETYFAHNSELAYFVKLGVEIARYQAMTTIGLSPQVLAAGYLEDGTSIVVQPIIAGRKPSRRDYRLHLDQFATAIHKLHHSPEAKRVLPIAPSDLYRDAGLESLARIQQRWEHYRPLVPVVAEFVDESLAYLAQQIQEFQGAGLAASHNDICNANWLVSPEGKLYLIDLESMSLDDPAVDIGATLWWYYPPELRPRFLEITGYQNDESFPFRMHVRMAMHCFSITIPREQSFEKLDPATYHQSLTDFRAVLAGEENPEGYDN